MEIACLGILLTNSAMALVTFNTTIPQSALTTQESENTIKEKGNENLKLFYG